MSLELKYRNRLHEVAREVTKRLVFIILTFLCIVDCCCRNVVTIAEVFLCPKTNKQKKNLKRFDFKEKKLLPWVNLVVEDSLLTAVTFFFCGHEQIILHTEP